MTKEVEDIVVVLISVLKRLHDIKLMEDNYTEEFSRMLEKRDELLNKLTEL